MSFCSWVGVYPLGVGIIVSIIAALQKILQLAYHFLWGRHRPFRLGQSLLPPLQPCYIGHEFIFILYGILELLLEAGLSRAELIQV